MIFHFDYVRKFNKTCQRYKNHFPAKFMMLFPALLGLISSEDFCYLGNSSKECPTGSKKIVSTSEISSLNENISIYIFNDEDSPFVLYDNLSNSNTNYTVSVFGDNDNIIHLIHGSEHTNSHYILNNICFGRFEDTIKLSSLSLFNISYSTDITYVYIETMVFDTISIHKNFRYSDGTLIIDNKSIIPNEITIDT